MERSRGDWVLATDVQRYYRCLPFDWYVVTPLSDEHAPERGELVQFKAPSFVARLTEQFEIIKIVAAVEGDRWRITEDKLYINEILWGDLHLLTSLGLAKGAMDGEGVVPYEHVYVLGTNPSSYDSRYWGPLPEQNITGNAYVVL
jgi:conjugal transfer pilin signal peptidase TrbI